MTIVIEEKVKRLENGAVFLPKHFWEWLKVENGDEVCIGLDQSKHGKYVAVYKKSVE